LFYWMLKLVLIGPLLKAVFRPVVEGEENVPDEGAAILACNHLSYADWLFMPLALSRRVTFVAKAEYFEGRGLKGWAQRTFFSGAGQVPIDRSGPHRRRPHGARGRCARHPHGGPAHRGDRAAG
jgi:1-acyl-sn-glycerol-3-phosphate acyltransferase